MRTVRPGGGGPVSESSRELLTWTPWGMHALQGRGLHPREGP